MTFLGSITKTVRIYTGSQSTVLTSYQGLISNSERKSLGVAIGSVLRIQHIIQSRDSSVLVGDLIDVSFETRLPGQSPRTIGN